MQKLKMIRNIIPIFCFFIGVAKAQSIPVLVERWNIVKRQSGYQFQHPAVDLLNHLSNKYLYNNPDSGLYYGKLALFLAQQQQYAQGRARAMNNIGKGYYVRGSYDSSLIISDSALKLSEAIHDSLEMGVAVCNIGLVYLGHEEFEKAIKQFTKALAIETAIKDSLQMTKNLFDLGVCQDEIGDYVKAVYFLTKAILTDPYTEDHHLTAMAYNRLGKTAFHQKSYAKGIVYYETVLHYRLYADTWETAFAFQGLSEIYYALGQQQKAIIYAQKGFEAAKSMHAKWDAEQALTILAKSQAAAGDFNKAYHYQVLDQAYKDSMYDEAKQQVEGYFKLQSKEAANAALQKENALIQEKVKLTRLINILISIFALTLVITIGLLWRSYRAKLRLNKSLIEKNERISDLNLMKDQLFSVVSHDLRGPMASLEQTLHYISENELPDGEQRFLLQSLSQQLAVSNHMLNNLLTWAANHRKGMVADIEKISPDFILKEVLAVFEPIAQKKQIRITYSNEQMLPLMADESQYKIIVQNLVSNAIKFTPEGGSINIYFTNGNGLASIHISDSGVGIAKEKLDKLFNSFGAAITTYGTAKEKGTGIGLMIVKDFTSQNNGRVSVESMVGTGTTFSVSYPAADYNKLV